jgi:hypothetical protein
VAELLCVVGNELEVVKLELDNVNKDKEQLCTKLEHIKVVHESMTSMKEEEERKLKALHEVGETDDGRSALQLVTLEFYKKMVGKHDEAIASLLVQQ